MTFLKTSIILIAAVLLFSCSKEELKYSCNPEVDEYVSENLTTLKSADILEISAYDDELQRAAYRSFSAEKKLELWNDKLTSLAGNDSFTPKEQAHITSLKEQLTVDLFKIDDDTAFTLFNAFYAEWENIAYTQLNWDKTMVIFITSSISLYYDDFINTSVLLNPVQSRASECFCNKSSDFCPDGLSCKGTICMNDAEDGCGVLWLEPCNGTCQAS